MSEKEEFPVTITIYGKKFHCSEGDKMTLTPFDGGFEIQLEMPKGQKLNSPVFKPVKK